jgi:hypothetical protein
MDQEQAFQDSPESIEEYVDLSKVFFCLEAALLTRNTATDT